MYWSLIFSILNYLLRFGSHIGDAVCNDPLTYGPLTVCALLYTLLLQWFQNFSLLLHFLVLNYFHVALFPCCGLLCFAISDIHFSLVALSSCWFFSVLHSFHVALFQYRTLFIFHYFFLFLCFLHAALFSSRIFLVLLFINVAFFSYSIFPCCTIFMMLFMCCTISLFSFYTFFVLDSFHIALSWVIFFSRTGFCQKTSEWLLFFMLCVNSAI